MSPRNVLRVGTFLTGEPTANPSIDVEAAFLQLLGLFGVLLMYDLAVEEVNRATGVVRSPISSAWALWRGSTWGHGSA